MFKLTNQLWNLGRGDLPDRPPAVSVVHDIALAVLFVALAFLTRWLLGYIGPVLIFAVCYPALLLATLIGGARAGIFALIFSVLSFWYVFVPEYYSFALPTVVDATNVVLYTIVGLIVVWIGERYRRVYTRLQVERARGELLVREMQHRAKNGLAVASSIIHQTLKADPETAKTIIGRLTALRAGDELMWTESRTPMSLDALLLQELAGYDPARLTISGPDAEVSAELARTLCLVVHELATNAVKYGAWSTGTGHVGISWGPGPSPTYLKWSERGGPPPKDSGKTGFGTFLIARLLTQHRGKLSTNFTPDGVECVATFLDRAN